MVVIRYTLAAQCIFYSFFFCLPCFVQVGIVAYVLSHLSIRLTKYFTTVTFGKYAITCYGLLRLNTVKFSILLDLHASVLRQHVHWEAIL